MLLYIVICILDIVLIILDHEISYYTKLFGTLVLLLAYCYVTIKLDKLVLLYFGVLAISDFFSIFYELFNESIFTTAITFLILIKILRNFVSFKIKTGTIFNLIVFFALFGVVYVYVLEGKEDSSIPILIYGIALCVTMAISLSMYLVKPNTTTLMFLGAMILRVFSDALLALILFSEDIDVIFDVLSSTIYFVSNYCLYRGFVMKEEPSKNHGLTLTTFI